MRLVKVKYGQENNFILKLQKIYLKNYRNYDDILLELIII